MIWEACANEVSYLWPTESVISRQGIRYLFLSVIWEQMWSNIWDIHEPTGAARYVLTVYLSFDELYALITKLRSPSWGRKEPLQISAALLRHSSHPGRWHASWKTSIESVAVGIYCFCWNLPSHGGKHLRRPEIQCVGSLGFGIGAWLGEYRKRWNLEQILRGISNQQEAKELSAWSLK